MYKSNEQFNDFWLSYVDLLSILIIALIIILFTLFADISKLSEDIHLKNSLIEEKRKQIKSYEKRMTDKDVGIEEETTGVKFSIIQALKIAFEENSVPVTVDGRTGNITMDSQILFDYDKSELKPEGKMALEAFFDIYFETLTQSNFQKHLSVIQIVGYTDAQGEFDYNLILSQDRAMSVVTYLLSDQYKGLSQYEKARLRQYIIGYGKSENDLVYVNGYYQEAASRRVIIGFQLKDQDNIEKIESVFLEGDEND